MRSLPRRLSAALYALWFVLYLGAPGLVHPCPEHTPQGASRSAQAGHSGHSTAQHAAAESPEAPKSAEECCCPGPQCGASAMVSAVATWVVAATVAAQAPVFVSADSAPPARPSHLLPFATAPPASIA